MALIRQFAFLAALLASLSAQTARFGVPACSADDRELADRGFFILCHSASRKVPVWVGYELTPEHLHRVASRPSRFRADQALSHSGAQDSDYRYSGYSRGHMAPAADFAWSAEAIRATFVLSNAAPQWQHVNTGLWAQFERAVRRIAADADAVYVFSGPIFEGEPPVIGTGRVAVPSHFFKAALVLKAGHRTMFAAILPNASSLVGPLGRFLTSVNEIQHRTGLDFFSELEDEEERTLESGGSSVLNLARRGTPGVLFQ